jgi:small subunit ribosomal protein S1
VSFSLEGSDPSQDQDMGELLDSLDQMKPLRRGDIVDGVVMRFDSDGLLVNIGHKAEGLVPATEMKSLDVDSRENLNIGDDVVVFVVRGESSDEPVILSIDAAIGDKGWRTLEKALESQERVFGKILGFNRGGALVQVEGVQGFVPISQLVSVPRYKLQDQSTDTADGQIDSNSNTEQSNQSTYIGMELELNVLEVNRVRNRAILTEKEAAKELRDQRKAILIKDLSEGEVRTGRVTGISSFGAFVDIGGADGLVHISEISWGPVKSPEDIVTVGQELQVYVLRVDTQNMKIALSIKRLDREPWETVNELYQVGDIVQATVTKLTDFGAFARLENSVEGLIHISEMSDNMINHPRDVLNEDDEVMLKILRIEPEKRRLGLSFKQAQEEVNDDLPNMDSDMDSDMDVTEDAITPVTDEAIEDEIKKTDFSSAEIKPYKNQEIQTDTDSE